MGPLALFLLLLAPMAPQDTPVEVGRRALERGAVDEAEGHFRAALTRGETRGAWEGLFAVAAARGDADAALVYAAELALVAADAAGVAPELPRGAAPAGLLANASLAKWPKELARRRAAAARELTEAAAARSRALARDPGGALVAAWLRRLALEVAGPMPLVRSALGDGLDPNVQTIDGGHVGVLKALERAMSSAHSNGRPGEAVRAARILHGLGVQADFTHLEGPRPSGMARWRATGAEMLQRARERLAEEHPEPWTVEELEWLSSEAGDAFTRKHRSFALPGVAVSPRGWYRIESDCGLETLLGVARTIEDHHERLARFFGRDPFIEQRGTAAEKVVRQGLVRIVPTADGLEAEGAPFFWAGGFQSGDVTVMRFSVGDIEGLGHGLTHELTHRFDGALHPGIPAWLAEGRAVWTGAAYGPSSDRDFVPNHAAFGTFSHVLGRGYGGAGLLGALIQGEPRDYRENYSAGYALYVFLNTWPAGGTPLFRAALQAFERSGGAKDAAAARAKFLQYFCDGKDGRPRNLDAFAELFAEFLRGFYWKEPAPWRDRYTEAVPAGGSSGWVYDDPTWVWSWQRAEPTFGQDQARLAGELFLELGQRDQALAALVWARSQDGFVPRTHHALAAALAGAKRADDSAWVVRSELAFPYQQPEAAFPGLAALRATQALLDGYAEAARASAAAPRARALFTAEHRRLARWLGVPPLEIDSDSPAVFLDERAPLLLDTFDDARLVGYDEDRPKRAFGVVDGGDLVLGARQDRDGTGRFDQSGGQLAFALAEPWQLPGAYRVRTRVRFRTGYCHMEFVVGTTRRDRNVRFRVTAGDYLYAIGEQTAEPEFAEVGYGFSGLRDRDGGLGGALRSGSFPLERARTAVDVELLIDGASVTAYLDGVEVAAYHTIDGAPLEGRVGFAARSGIVRLERPTVQRLDRGVAVGRPARTPRSLDLSAPTGPDFTGLENLPVRGLPPSSTGRVVLWIPQDENTGAAQVAKLARMAAKLSERAAAEGILQPLSLAVPTALGDEALAELVAATAGLEPRVTIERHRLTSERVGEASDQGRTWVFFVDAASVVRVTLPWLEGASLREREFQHWITVFRENGAPPRALPEVTRER